MHDSTANRTSTPCAPGFPNTIQSSSVNMITRTYQLTAKDPFRLQQRLQVLREALGIRGGKITTVQWKGRHSGKHSVKVKYEVPDSFVPAFGL